RTRRHLEDPRRDDRRGEPDGKLSVPARPRPRYDLVRRAAEPDAGQGGPGRRARRDAGTGGRARRAGIATRPRAPPTPPPPSDPGIGGPEASTPAPGPAEPAAPPAAKPAPVAASHTKTYWLRVMTGGTADAAGRLVSRLREDKLPIAIDR